MEDGKVRIEKFDGKDFGFWKMQIEDYLHQRDLYQPLEETKPSAMKEEDWKVLDRKALGVVILSLSRNVAYNVKDEKTTAGLIKTLSMRALEEENPGSHPERHMRLRVGEGEDNKGHVKRSCPKIKKKGKGKSQGSDEDEDASTNSVTEYDSDALCVSTECFVDAWVLDSGSSVHSTPCKELFRRFKSEKLEDVHLVNGECVKVMGSGDVSVKLTNGGFLELKDVMYIPKLKKSLISVCKLDKAGYKVVFERGSWRIVKGALVEAHWKLNGSLYTSGNTCVGVEGGCDTLKMVSFGETSQNKGAHMGVVSDVKKTHKDVVWVKIVHKGVAHEKLAKGVVFGWEHGRNALQTKGKDKSSCVVMDGVKFGWEHGGNARRTKKNSITCDGDSGLDETSVLLPW
uniref:Retrovirus-related Pol polyprotein from transposon TNT 1-94-like beta-barrel domain-containing protein n=1 Tax=Chenopodium quinoa TaxID=63459 RepID=A0A803N665_CHEQI